MIIRANINVSLNIMFDELIKSGKFTGKKKQDKKHDQL